jgi:CheY-like chemotaxis protein
LIEGDAASRRLIHTVLQAKHYRVEQAEDPEQAQAVLATLTPRLVLLDIRLKGRSGLDLLKKIRAEPRLHRVPVVAITAQAMKDDGGRILAAGCDAYLSKPIDTRTLPQIVEELLKNGRVQA